MKSTATIYDRGESDSIGDVRVLGGWRMPRAHRRSQYAEDTSDRHAEGGVHGAMAATLPEQLSAPAAR